MKQSVSEKQPQGHSSDVLLIERKTAAARYSMSKRQLDYLIEGGVIPAVRIGKRGLRIPVAQADAALLGMAVKGPSHD